VLDSLPVPVAAQDAAGTIVYANRAGCERFGFSPSDLEGCTAADFLDPANRRVWNRQLGKQGKRAAGPYLITWRTSRGRFRTQVFPVALHGANGEFAGSAAIVIPIDADGAMAAADRHALARATSALSSAVPGFGAETTRPAAVISALERLSPRERELLLLALHGLSGPAVARRLGIRAQTARNHFKSIYRKLAVRSRLELLARFVETAARESPRSALDRERQPEGRPDARGALHLESRTDQVGQAPADRQPQARAAVRTRRRAIQLRERAK
jgi:PAS domain S-box-containing protein